MLTLPTGLTEHNQHRSRAGNDSAATNCSPQQQQRQHQGNFLFLQWARAGGNAQTPRTGNPTRPLSTEAAPLLAREGALDPESNGTHQAQAFENQFYLNNFKYITIEE